VRRCPWLSRWLDDIGNALKPSFGDIGTEADRAPASRPHHQGGHRVAGSRIFGGWLIRRKERCMIRKLPSGGFRLYSRKKDPRTGRRRNLGTFRSRAAAKKHEREVQYFKRH
jgi:hypothetical protein